MYQPDEVKIIQEIANRVIPVAEPGWTELVISCYVEGDVSNFCGSYLINEKEGIKEKGLPYFHDLDGRLRILQACIARDSKQVFTSCKLHFWSSGKFETNYGYERVDWDSLIYSSSNFYPRGIDK